jgi:putative addiction module killer protein
MRVREYIAQDGSVPFKKWFDGLNSLAAAKISTALVRIELGKTSNIKWFSGLGEYVIDWGPGYRIYFFQEGLDIIVLLGGGTKTRQKRDIDRARKLLSEHKSRR